VAGSGLVAALTLVFCVVNVFGVRWFARINTAIVWWKLGIIVLVIVVFPVLSFNADHLTSAGGFAPNGAHGVFFAIAKGGIAFSYFGFRQGVEPAGETRNPQRNIRLILIGSVVICGVIYLLLQLAFLGAVPTSSLSGGWASVGTNFSGDTNWSGWDINGKLFVAVPLGFVLLGVHELVHRGRTPQIDFRHGMWVLSWLGGLCLISWIGSFPEPSKGASNLGVLDLNLGFVATFLPSVLVMWPAQRYRLPADRVAALVPEETRVAG
jgi:amino acid transporter